MRSEMPETRRILTNPVIGYLSVIAAAVLWASSGTVSKALFLGGVTPFQLVQIRLTIAAFSLGLFLRLFTKQRLRIRTQDIAYFLVLGGVGLALVQAAYLYTISKMQVAAAILIQYTSPVFVTAYSIGFWHERLTAIKVIALLLSLFGCYLVVGGYNLELLNVNRDGALAGLASAVLFALYSLLGERVMHRYQPWTVVLYALVFAALTWNILQPPLHFVYFAYTAEQWIYMLYIAIFGTIIPFGLFFVGVNYIRSTRATITSTVEPISAGFIAFILLGETLDPLQIIGGVFVIAAIVLLQVQSEKDELSPARIRAGRDEG
ncbi:MAG TPA: DMT family transporter [Desulfomonilaceae bacterium]|nr:DMT family transporter [Desulfomonilaceae bacterium]